MISFTFGCLVILLPLMISHTCIVHAIKSKFILRAQYIITSIDDTLGYSKLEGWPHALLCHYTLCGDSQAVTSTSKIEEVPWWRRPIPWSMSIYGIKNITDSRTNVSFFVYTYKSKKGYTILLNSYHYFKKHYTSHYNTRYYKHKNNWQVQ